MENGRRQHCQLQPQNATGAQTQNDGWADSDDGRTEAGGIPTLLDVLPAELLASILYHLGIVDLAHVAVTCAALRAAAMDEAVWRHRVREDHGKRLLLMEEPTAADFDALDRTWKWFYQACRLRAPKPIDDDSDDSTGRDNASGDDNVGSEDDRDDDKGGTYAHDNPTLSVEAAQYVPGVCIYGGDHGSGGTLDGPGVLTEVDGDWDYWFIGRWTAGALSGRCRFVQREAGITVSRYEGDAVDCKPHGHGVEVYAGGMRYVGSWRDGAKSGHGTLYNADGTPHYVGDHLDNLPHGRGCIYHDDGTQVDGEFACGKLDGHATIEYARGEGAHSGLFRAGLRHGPGRYTQNDGFVLDAVWSDGVVVGDVNAIMARGDLYKGGWSDGRPHGLGSMTSTDGLVYTGRWEKGQAVGEHVMRSHPACRGRPGHDHAADVYTTSIRVMPCDRVTKLHLPNGDRMDFAYDDIDDPTNVDGILRYRVSNAHPVHGDRLFVCAARSVSSNDEYTGFGVSHVGGPDAALVVALLASGWPCYSEGLLRAAAPALVFDSIALDSVPHDSVPHIGGTDP